MSDSPVGLVGDIGGTNVRLALAGRAPPGGLVIAGRQDLRADDHPDLKSCIEVYLAGLGAAPRPTLAAFGVAGPVTGDSVRLTNRDWAFSIEGLRSRFGWEHLRVVNDFVILGHALPALGRKDLMTLPGPAWPDSLPPVVSVVGPGTGLGVAAVLTGPRGHRVTPTEGGHAGFAPFDELEIQLLRALLQRFQRVSNERLLSGPGLENLYAAMSEVCGQVATLTGAPAILQAALAGDDALARDTVERFALILAGALGDIALVQGAGAVAIAGGVALRMTSFLDSAAVRARFEAKGRAGAVMAALPLALIIHPEPALLGAARLLFEPEG